MKLNEYDNTVVWWTLFILLLTVLVPYIFFLVAQQNTLRVVDVQHRTMLPEQVWLQLIPVFGLVWQFIVVKNIAALWPV